MSGLAVVLVCLSGFAIWVAVSTNASAQHVRYADAQRNAFASARDAVATEESLGRQYRLEPSQQIRARFGAASRRMVAALQIGERLNPADARAVGETLQLHSLYLNAIKRMFAAVDDGEGGREVGIESRDVGPVLAAIEKTVNAKAQVYAQDSSDSLHAMQEKDRLVLIGTPIIFTLGFLLLVTFAGIVVRSRKRLEAARRAEIERLQHAVLVDNLTGSRNQRSFQEDLTREIKRQARSGTPLSLVTLDLKGLKHVNDTFGHHKGDERLKYLAATLRQAMRGSDAVYRLGGDEFALLLPGTAAANAFQFMQRLQGTLEAHDPRLEIAVGIADTHGFVDKDALFRRADLALIESKRSHRALIYSEEFEPAVQTRDHDAPGEDAETMLAAKTSASSEALEAAVVVGASFDAIVGRTPEGIVTGWNAAAERMFGYSADEMIGRSIATLEPPDRAGELNSVNQALRRSGRLEPYETVRLRKDGARVDIETTLSPIVDPSGALIAVSAISRDISERVRSRALLSGQARLLELIAGGTPLAELLDLVTRFVEEQSPELIASILLLDPDGVRLRHGAGPSLPESYRAAIDGVAVGPRAGSCGTAAYRREPVVVSDIATDPLWTDYRELALAAGLRACWSDPILAVDGALLGTFAIYYREPRDPGEYDIQLVRVATHVAGIAIERSVSEQALQLSEQRYRDLFENANEPIATVALDDTITEVNAAFEQVLGFSRQELIGTSLQRYLTPSGYETAVRQGQLKLAGEASGTSFEQEFIAKDGTSVILNVSSRIIEEHGRPVGIQGICRDVTAFKQAQAELHQLAELNRHQALHDGLTELPNRVSFCERIEQAIGRGSKEGDQFAVLLIDLDRFKDINDTLGHHYGDRLLIELARRLGTVVRHTDMIARLGGDEFGMLVASLADGANGIESAVHRILTALDQPFQVDGLPLQVEASIGIACYPADGGDVDLLLQRADVAMYVAKQKGATHALYTPELDRHDTANLTLLAELPEAIRDRRLLLHYQPKADARTGEITSVEALVRWQHPTRGLIGPAEFIPAAERTALIEPLAAFVLDEALAQSKRWEADGIVVSVAVNLSMRNLHDVSLPAQVEGLLRKWSLPSDRLWLEITESTIATDPERTKVTIRQLSELGVGIAIDDFGIGYTSLAYLARLAVDQIKIDRSFVASMETDADNAAIVRAIIALGHDLGLEVIAEGVETRAAHEKLKELGCNLIQGYHLSRPLPPEELTSMLKRRHLVRLPEHGAVA